MRKRDFAIFAGVGIVTVFAVWAFLLRGTGRTLGEIAESTPKNVRSNVAASDADRGGTDSLARAAPSPPSDINADLNPNGVRVDIDALIRKRFPDSKEQRAMLQYARANQTFLSSGSSSEAGAKDGAQMLDQSIACLRSVMGPGYLDVANELTASMLNTKDRFTAYAKATQNLSGQVVIGYSGEEPCEQ